MNFTRIIKKVNINPLWCEKYCPSQIEQFYGDNLELESIFKHTKENPDFLSSMILIGPNGCGKSTFTKLLCKNILKDNYSQNLLELYCSINRNKTYLNNKLLIDNKNISDFINNTNKKLKLKIITVYDIDTATYETQNLLVELLKFSHVRIIFTCNSVNNINNNILSSVIQVYINNVSYEESMNILCDICLKENLVLDNELKKIICITCSGDIKKIFGLMQTLSGVVEPSVEKFYKLIDIPSYETINSIINYCSENNCIMAYKSANALILNGYDISDIINMIEKTLIYIDLFNSNFNKETQNHMLQVVTHYLVFNKHTVIQLFNMISKMCFTA